MYKRKTNRPPRADKGKKKPPAYMYKMPAGTTRADFLDTIAFIRKL